MPIHQVENTTFNNDVNITNKCNLMKDCAMDINIRPSKDKNSKYQSLSKPWTLKSFGALKSRSENVKRGFFFNAK